MLDKWERLVHCCRMDSSERAALGPLIREARKGIGMKLEELEDASGISRRTISDIERGIRVGNTETLRRLLPLLGVQVTAALDPDVRAFIEMLGPLLQRLSQDERGAVMPVVVKIVAEALRPPSGPIEAGGDTGAGDRQGRVG